MSRSYLDSPHGGFGISYSNLLSQYGAAANPQFGTGNDFLVNNWAYVTTPNGTDQLVFIWNPRHAFWFEPDGSGGYNPLYGSRIVLTYATIDGVDYYRLCDPDSGAVYLFDPVSGFCVKMITAGGQETINTLSGDGSRIVSTTPR